MTTALAEKDKCLALRSLLADGRWHGMAELQDVAGYRYGGRVHEVRRGDDGRPPLTVEAKRGARNEWQYRATQSDPIRTNSTQSTSRAVEFLPTSTCSAPGPQPSGAFFKAPSVKAFEVCAKCGKAWFGGSAVHAPHFRDGVLEDCSEGKL